MYIVTEYGIALLKGRSVAERARALIDIAHPQFREGLEREAREKNILPKNLWPAGEARSLLRRVVRKIGPEPSSRGVPGLGDRVDAQRGAEGSSPDSPGRGPAGDWRHSPGPIVNVMSVVTSVTGFETVYGGNRHEQAREEGEQQLALRIRGILPPGISSVRISPCRCHPARRSQVRAPATAGRGAAGIGSFQPSNHLPEEAGSSVGTRASRASPRAAACLREFSRT
jgi:hypothetical protein